MSMEQIQPADLQHNSGAWVAFTKLSFALAFGATLIGIWLMPVDLWIRGYLVMGIIYTVGSSFSLAKTLRDEHESAKLLNRITNAKTAKILRQYDAE
ncbi:MAG: YiaA/YiaB family inner membrane protein [Acidobacteriota bacterium]